MHYSACASFVVAVFEFNRKRRADKTQMYMYLVLVAIDQSFICAHDEKVKFEYFTRKCLTGKEFR